MAKRQMLAKHNAYVKPLRAWYDMADVRHVSAGRAWYLDAQAFCSGLSDRYGIARWRVCAMVSAISPAVSWEENQRQAEQLCRAFASGIPLADVMVTTYTMQARKGRRLLEDGTLQQTDVEAVLGRRAWKTKAFYLGLMYADGLPDSIVVDRWIMRAAGFEDGGQYISLGLYRAVAGALWIIADDVGVCVNVLQAIIWVTIRDTLEREADKSRRETTLAKTTPAEIPF